MYDMDPGRPAGAELPSSSIAKQRANFGDADPEAFSEQRRAPAAAAAVPPPMPIDVKQAQAFLTACETSTPRVAYGLGEKVPFFQAKPGVDFREVDCSGFVREAIREATNPMVPFPDGSVVQHDWVRSKGYRSSTVEAGKAKDGKVRDRFLVASRDLEWHRPRRFDLQRPHLGVAWRRGA